MSLNIVELFGFSPSDKSQNALTNIKKRWCPFIGRKCTKKLSDGTISGVCTVEQVSSGPVICCPNRLYSDGYKILKEISDISFGKGKILAPGNKFKSSDAAKTAAVFGKFWGKELRLPKRQGAGNYFVDWVLASLGVKGELNEFVAVEVQSIDTTGNYRAEREAILKGSPLPKRSEAGLNWENVNKRILPQLIYKGNVLRRESCCKKGLFFICPIQVYQKILIRLGGSLAEYPTDKGTITFRWYSLDERVEFGKPRELIFSGSFTTTTEQITLAFDRATDLPNPGVYEQAIKEALKL